MAAMKRVIGRLAALALAACAAAAIAGCGSQSNDASVASTPPAERAPASIATSTSTAPAPVTTSTATVSPSTASPTSTAGGTPAPGATHTAQEPAFTEQESHTEGLEQAEAALQERGYAASETSQYHPSQTLRVLVGTKAGAGEAGHQQAFFFVDGRYLGTDAKEASAAISIVSQSDTEVTLAYALYRPGDSLSSPSGGRATVRFALDDGKLTALEPIPPANSTTGLSRR